MGEPLALAVALAAAIILSAPYAQELFIAISTAWPGQFRAIAVGATAVPAGIALLYAVARIRHRHLAPIHAVDSSRDRWDRLRVHRGASASRRVSTSSNTACSGSCSAEYGARPTTCRWWFCPCVAGTIAGTLDEWFQWFIPVRAGEARDIVLNAVASVCGMLFALGMDPPAPVDAAVPTPIQAACFRMDHCGHRRICGLLSHRARGLRRQ